MSETINDIAQGRSMSPQRRECLGFYLYGSGYMSEHTRARQIALGLRQEPTYCNTQCDKVRTCIQRSRNIVKRDDPEGVEQFEEVIEKVQRDTKMPRDSAAGVAAAVMQKQHGKMEPLQERSLALYKIGARHAARDKLTEQ